MMAYKEMERSGTSPINLFSWIFFPQRIIDNVKDFSHYGLWSRREQKQAHWRCKSEELQRDQSFGLYFTSL